MNKRKTTPPSPPLRNRSRLLPNQTMPIGLDDIWARLEKLDTRLDKLDTIDKKIDVLEEKYETFTSKHTVLETKVNSNRDYLNNLQHTLDEVQLKVSHFERVKISANLIVTGIPKHSEEIEDLPQTILTLCGALDIPLIATDIISCRRMIINSGTGPIVVSLKDESTKIGIFNKWREVIKIGKHPSTNQNIKKLYEKLQLPSTNYINITEEETKFTYNLFREAQYKLKGKFKYVWKTNGHIFTKFDDNNRSVKIVSSNQIDDLAFNFEQKTAMETTKTPNNDNSFMSSRSSY